MIGSYGPDARARPYTLTKIRRARLNLNQARRQRSCTLGFRNMKLTYTVISEFSMFIRENLSVINNPGDELLLLTDELSHSQTESSTKIVINQESISAPSFAYTRTGLSISSFGFVISTNVLPIRHFI